MKKRVCAAAAITAAVALGLGACSKNKTAGRATAFPDSLVIGEVIAVVNGDTITAKDIKVLVYTTFPAPGDSLKSRSFNLKLLDEMIKRKLFIQEAKAVGTTLSDSLLERLMAQFDAQLGGREQIDTKLSPLGFTRADVRETLRRDLTIQAYVQQSLKPKITINEADVRAYFDQNQASLAGQDSVRLRHIIVLVKEDDADTTKAERRAFIESVRQRAVKGEDFARLAQKYSQDGAAPLGGDLGYSARGMMVPEFEQVAWSLKKGQMSQVVETRFGYHLILCVDKKKGVPAQYDAWKDDIEAELKNKALTTEIQNRLKKDREAAIITRNYDEGA